jgi:protein-S-isoprenylcysteine O-methyltransferase Ste14
MEHDAARIGWMETKELTEAAASVPKATPASPAPEASPTHSGPDTGLPQSVRFRNALGNICLALLFFVALIPAKAQYHSGIANDIWLGGAVLMGVLSLVRVPPRSAMVNLRSILSAAAMMTIPALMRPGTSSTGVLADLAIVIELIGIAFTQISRIYLGRRFGLLPANRGIVSGGPFRLMRHPIYSGWLVLTVGFLMAYPTPRNIGMLFLSLPFLVWRMDLEEEHLNEDPEYRRYAAKTPYRLIPGIY